MRILVVSVEVAPFAKVGGLADVAGALPKALFALGHDARIVMPLYKMIEDDPRWSLSGIKVEFTVDLGPMGIKRAFVKEMVWEGVPVMFVGTDEWYTEAVSSETLYQPGGIQHLFFSKAVLIAMEMLDWMPDVVHCNDWHTGFVPALMRERDDELWDDVASVYTIHNLAYQGEFGTEVLDALGLPHHLFNHEQVEAWGRVNFLKAGCVYSDRVNTVSERYAVEIQTREFGCSLDGLMADLARSGRLSGILNGIDTDVFDPSTDPDLPARFSASDRSGKAVCREQLLAEVEMDPIPNTPLIGVVSRLSSQKGMDLILNASDALFSLPIQLIIQGLGDPALAAAFRSLEARYPKYFRFVNRFDPPIAQRVYGGCDAFLMPSSFEPCGLGQMIAMRYGTVPIVRATGGLADTIFEGRNGFLFERRDPFDLAEAVSRARGVFQKQAKWSQLSVNGMKGDYSWRHNATAYVEMYERARLDRSIGIAISA